MSSSSYSSDDSEGSSTQSYQSETSKRSKRGKRSKIAKGYGSVSKRRRKSKAKRKKSKIKRKSKRKGKSQRNNTRSHIGRQGPWSSMSQVSQMSQLSTGSAESFIEDRYSNANTKKDATVYISLEHFEQICESANEIVKYKRGKGKRGGKRGGGSKRKTNYDVENSENITTRVSITSPTIKEYKELLYESMKKVANQMNGKRGGNHTTNRMTPPSICDEKCQSKDPCHPKESINKKSPEKFEHTKELSKRKSDSPKEKSIRIAQPQPQPKVLNKSNPHSDGPSTPHHGIKSATSIKPSATDSLIPISSKSITKKQHSPEKSLANLNRIKADDSKHLDKKIELNPLAAKHKQFIEKQHHQPTTTLEKSTKERETAPDAVVVVKAPPDAMPPIKFSAVPLKSNIKPKSNSSLASQGKSKALPVGGGGSDGSKSKKFPPGVPPKLQFRPVKIQPRPPVPLTSTPIAGGNSSTNAPSSSSSSSNANNETAKPKSNITSDSDSIETKK